MPGAILPNMGLQLPELGGDSGDWDDLVNAMFGVVDLHDHTAGKGVLVPTAGLNINADLPFAGFGPTGLGKLAFNAVTALVSGSKSIFVSSADNELYWRTNAGVNVKLTNGSSINTTLVGGIVGDHAAVGAEVAYDDANDRYTFKQQGSPKPWARIACGGVRVFEFNTTETVYVGLKAPAALAASWDVTFPLAAPGSTSVVLMDSSGVLSVSNTIPNATTFTSAATFSTSLTTPTIAGTPNFTGAVTMASTLGVTGELNATGEINALDDFVLTGQFYHGNRTVVQGLDEVISGTVSLGGSSIPVYTVGIGSDVLTPFKADLISGISRVKSIAVIFANNTVPTLKLVTVVSPTVSTELTTGLGITAADTVVDGGHTKRTFTINGGGTVIPAGQRQLFSLHNAAASTLDVFNIEVVYDAPEP